MPQTPLRERLRGSFVHVPRTIRLVYRASPWSTVALGGLTIAGALLPLGVAAAAKAIVDAVMSGDRDRAIRWIAIEAALVVLVAAAQRGLGLVRSVLGARLGLDINVWILEKTQTLQLWHFEDPDVYDRLTRARREASARPISVVLETFQIAQNLLTLTGYIVLIASYSGWVVLALIAATIPATVAEVRFSTAAFRLRNWRSPDARRLNYLEHVLANDEYAKEVLVFGFGPLLLDRYKALGEAFYREDRALAISRAAWALGLSILATLAFYGSYGAMGIAAAAGAISLGQMTLYVMSFRQGQQAFQSILGALGGMYEDNLYMSNLFSFLEMDVRAPLKQAPSEQPTSKQAVSERATPEQATSGGATAEQATSNEAANPPEGIVFRDVGFRYPDREEWALRHIDLRLAPGRRVALVGHNGAGKTTFIKLLTRLYEPTEGEILLDGKPLHDWDVQALRQRIGVVFQDYGQYKLSARETVGVGDVRHLADTDRIERAVERGGAAEVVAGLPQKLETQLGRWFKNGVELSGGQWQKLALSRAFLREDADILILDEPTAALDAEAEHAVFERFQRLAAQKTSIVISHRFPTVRLAEQIIVLEKGQIVEQGSHETLVGKGGLYARLFSLQQQGYL